MKINEALEHQKWKLENSDKTTKKDIEAFNAVLRWKNEQEAIVCHENEKLAKMWLNTFIGLCQSNCFTASMAINHIDKEILDKTVFEWCEVLRAELWKFKFNSIGAKENPVKDHYNLSEKIELNKKIVSENQDAMFKAMHEELTIGDVIAFVEQQINRIIKH